VIGLIGCPTRAFGRRGAPYGLRSGCIARHLLRHALTHGSERGIRRPRAERANTIHHRHVGRSLVLPASLGNVSDRHDLYWKTVEGMVHDNSTSALARAEQCAHAASVAAAEIARPGA